MNAQEANERCVGLALTLSAEMLKNGGETYRAEDCALRVLAAAGSVDTQVMAMPTNVLVTATFGSQTITRSRSVCGRSIWRRSTGSTPSRARLRRARWTSRGPSPRSAPAARCVPSG